MIWPLIILGVGCLVAVVVAVCCAFGNAIDASREDSGTEEES